MENTKVTREELQALGLSEEEIKAMLGAAEANEGTGGLPFPLVKINYDAEAAKLGEMGYNPIKDDEGFLTGYERVFTNPYQIRILDSYYQYSAFDATTNKPSVTSNLFRLKDAKKAYDLKTGKLISDLKKTNDQIKFSRVALVEIRQDDDDTSVFGIFYMKGKWLYDLGQAVKKDKIPEGQKILTLNNKKQKNGAVTFFTVEVIDEKIVDRTTFLQGIKEDANKMKQFQDWTKEVNSSSDEPAKTSQSSDSDNPFADDDDDDIVF